MILWKTAFKVFLLSLPILIILALLKQKPHSVKQTQPQITQKKPGWTKEKEQFVLNNCPSIVSRQTCNCMLQKAEGQYSYDQVVTMYQNYKSSGKVDPSIFMLLASCH